MACSYPITLVRNGRHELVPCNRCIDCIQRKRAEWSFRLLQELKTAVKATFLTLTYDETAITKDYQLKKTDLQKYFKRVRSKCSELKYYAVGEYGGKTARPHYHAIVFNVDNSLLIDKWRKSSDMVDENTGEITTVDKSIGFVTTDQVSEASIHYVTGYVTSKYGKIDEKTGKALPDDRWSESTIRPFSIMSKGLGKIYLKHNSKLHKSSFKSDTRLDGGRSILLPRYYRNALFPKDDVGIKLGLVSNNNASLNTLKIYLLDKYEKLDFKAEFEKRQYNKLIIKNQIKKKTL